MSDDIDIGCHQVDADGSDRHGHPPTCNSVATPEPWNFAWLAHPLADAPQPDTPAQVTGRLRWRGFEYAFAADGLAGIDGRLSGPSLALLTPPLQQVVLQHFADDALRAIARGPLADIVLEAIEWHEAPEPMEGEFAFSLRRPGARVSSLGRLTAFDAVGRTALLDALAAAGWPLPAETARVAGRLHIGSVQLSAAEVSSLEPGDLVWIDDAELAPSGLRTKFRADGEAASHAAWIKRSAMTRDITPITVPHDGASTGLAVTSAPISVERAWLQGRLTLQRLHAPTLALVWQIVEGGQPRVEGRLWVIGRRLGLRLTRTLSSADTAKAI